MNVTMCTSLRVCNLPLEMQIEKVQNYLQSENTSKTGVEIFNATGVDIYGNEEIYQTLSDSVSNVKEGKDGTWRTVIVVRNRTELVILLANSPDGVLKTDLCNSYSGVLEDMMEMKELGEIYELHSGNTVTIYPRDRWLEVKIDKDIIDAYNGVEVPDYSELHQYLVAHQQKKDKQN